jgi:hypothetical protein
MKAASPQIRGRQNQRSRPIDEPLSRVNPRVLPCTLFRYAGPVFVQNFLQTVVSSYERKQRKLKLRNWKFLLTFFSTAA